MERRFPDGSVVEDQPVSAGDAGSAPGWGEPHILQSSQAMSLCSRAQEPQPLKLTCPGVCAPQKEKPLLTSPGEKPGRH